MKSTDITHPLWDIRGEYLQKMWSISQEVYKEFGGFVKGKDMSDRDIYFLIKPDGRVPFSFRTDGYFDINLDPLELDCYGDLEVVDYNVFKGKFSDLNNLLVKKFIDGEKYREHLLRDLHVAEDLIIDEMFEQIRKKNG